MCISRTVRRKVIMMKERNTDFCTACRKETEYEIKIIPKKEKIKEKEYEFQFTTAVCKNCGEEMMLPGLIDLNIRERDRQFRKAEDLISVEEIKKLMSLYHIGKAPLSLALGFGEVTVARYLDGQMPSKGYSDTMRSALYFPEHMEALLIQNREKVGETAYKKAKKAISELKELFAVSDKMLISIAYIFEQMQEVTPLALQKILYFIQGIYMVLFDKPLYPEECCAWVHGPVYEKVYDLFKGFRYNPIDDNRFVLFYGRSGQLTEEERRVIDLVVGTFGMYSGKVLETITHGERPWREARQGCEPWEHSHTVIPREEIKAYFAEVSRLYGIDSAEGLNRYIASRKM